MRITRLTTIRPDVTARVYVLPGIDLVTHDHTNVGFPPEREDMDQFQYFALRRTVATSRLMELADGVRVVSDTVEVDPERLSELLRTDIQALGQVLREAR